MLYFAKKSEKVYIYYKYVSNVELCETIHKANKNTKIKWGYIFENYILKANSNVYLSGVQGIMD